jgi:linoleoyl-CoA desaturase
MQKVKFQQVESTDFFKVLNQRVEAYFKTNGINRKSNFQFVFKNLFFFVLAVVFYALILSNKFSGWQLYPLFVFFGLFLTIFLFSIAHDASHNAVSEKNWVNRFFAYTWNMVGITCYFWELKHNLSHHGFTNVPGKDDDIDQSKLVRLNPKSARKWFHQFQHFYAPFLYALLSINIIYLKDFRLLMQKDFGNKKVDKHSVREVIILFVTKAVFIFYMIVIPKMVLGISWGEILLLHVMMHLAIGLFIGFILVPVHVTNESEYRLPDEKGVVHTDWGRHQIEATVDFAAENYLVNWLTGGLNTHVAHHLFPHINHIHYIPITKIIKQTAKEFNIPYRNRSLLNILAEHMRFLKALGQIDNPTSNPDFNLKAA